MSNLTVKQKKLIIEFIDETQTNFFDIDQCGSLYSELEAINDIEFLYQESNCFGQDYIWSDSDNVNGKAKFKKEHLKESEGK